MIILMTTYVLLHVYYKTKREKWQPTKPDEVSRLIIAAWHFIPVFVFSF